jgi:transposase InsO family protein
VFAWIDAEKAEFPITKLCQYLRVSPSGFYASRGRPESAHAQTDRRLRVLVRASFDESRQRYGSPRIHEDLIEQAERVSRKRIIRLMQEDGLEARARKRFKSTTMSDHDQPVAANLLDRRFEAPGPNQRWVGDTTEFVIGASGKLYLAAVLDLFSRFVVGWAVSAVNDRHVTIKALDMALKRRCPNAGLLHHSDQGCTYASEDYQAVLEVNGITCSMSRRGNCYDNAVMESFFSSVKSEVADRFDSCGEAKMELFDYIEVFYNQRRRHSTLGQISPAAFERGGPLKCERGRTGPDDDQRGPVGDPYTIRRGILRAIRVGYRVARVGGPGRVARPPCFHPHVGGRRISYFSSDRVADPGRRRAGLGQARERALVPRNADRVRPAVVDAASPSSRPLSAELVLSGDDDPLRGPLSALRVSLRHADVRRARGSPRWRRHPHRHVLLGQLQCRRLVHRDHPTGVCGTRQTDREP